MKKWWIVLAVVLTIAVAAVSGCVACRLSTPRGAVLSI